MSDPVPLRPNAPGWFANALAVPFEDGDVTVGGARVHYLAWGEPGRRGLVFVHGGGAHPHWWTHIAAPIAPQLRELALDLTGRGGRDQRDAYDLEQWAKEVLAIFQPRRRARAPGVVRH